jgi:hypothetical protein
MRAPPSYVKDFTGMAAETSTGSRLSSQEVSGPTGMQDSDSDSEAESVVCRSLTDSDLETDRGVVTFLDVPFL